MTMEISEIERALRTLHVDRSSGQPARHQPIMLLWAFGRIVTVQKRLAPWPEAERALTPLLEKHGIVGSTPAPEYPFVALHRSPLWELLGQEGEVPAARGSTLRRWLKTQDVAGGLLEPVHDLLASRRDALNRAVAAILNTFFEDYRDREELLLDAHLLDREFDGYGHPPYTPVGTTFRRRENVQWAAVHRPGQAGIWGTAHEDAKSIVLSGGYEDDEDHGDSIIYTGQGGQDAAKRQVRNQELTKGNAALVNSQSSGRPVRVTRLMEKEDQKSTGHKYRYDGLYRVTDHWSQEGKSGFLMCRYRLEIVEGASLSVGSSRDVNAARRIAQLPKGKNTPDRKESTTQRIVRNSQVKRVVKELHSYTCQVCDLRIETPTGAYAEGAHVRGLGTPHDGPDEPDNVLCLCPNHHVMFDYGMLAIADNGTVIERDRTGSETRRYTLTTHPDHKVNPDHLAYHRQHYAIGEVR